MLDYISQHEEVDEDLNLENLLSNNADENTVSNYCPKRNYDDCDPSISVESKNMEKRKRLRLLNETISDDENFPTSIFCDHSYAKSINALEKFIWSKGSL